MVGLALFFALSSPAFLTVDNLLLILQQCSIDAIAAIGLTMVLIGAGIDISQGSVMALAAMVAAIAMVNLRWPELVAILLGLMAGALVGLVNGFFAEKARIPAFIATLASLFVVRGIVMAYLGGQSIGLPLGVGDILRTLSVDRTLGIPNAVILTVILYLVAGLVMRRTVWGMRTYAVGSSSESASRAGVRVDRQRISIYIVAGTLSALAGLLLLGRLGSAPSELAQFREFYVVTAAIVGGTSVYGGRGKIWRSFMGAFFISMLANGLVIANVPAFYQQIAVGLALIFALVLDRLGADDDRH
jgi:ribose transport system permease protein